MKIPSIYSESNDEITSVIERLKSSHEPIVALVLPKGSPLGQSIVNLKLIRKAAQDAEKDVIIVSTDSITKNLGIQLGITVVKTEREVSRAASGELIEETGETPIISGVRIHRYYAEEGEASGEKPEAENLPAEIAPIIPKNLKREEVSLGEPVKAASPESLPAVETAPMTKRSIATIEIERAAKTEDSVKKADSPAKTAISLPPKEKGSKKSSRKRVIFLVILLLLLGTGTALAMPMSTVTITVASEAFDKTYPINALPGGSGDKINASELTTNAAATASVTASGTKKVGTAATGTATIFNSQDSSSQALAAGAIILANGRSFTTQNDVTVPGVQVKSGSLINGSVTVAVTANEVGPESNLQNIIGTISSPKTSLFAQITNTTGGTSKDVTIVTASDITKVRDAAQKDLLTKLRAARTDELVKAGETITTDKAERLTTKEVSLSHQAGEEAASVDINLEGSLAQSYVLLADAKSAAASKAGKEETNGRDLALGAITVGSVEANGAELTLSLQVAGSLIPRITATNKTLAGKSFTDAKAVLTAITGVGKVDISQTPSWWPIKLLSRIPAFTKIVTKNE